MDIGVDVFFVISGYLITQNLYKEYNNTRTINFRLFYTRRAKRLLPALYATILLTLFAGLFIFSVNDFKMLGEASVYTIFSISNILFWLQDNYFGGSAIIKPLLHTWSLGIEEQFYLIWPLLLLTLYKFSNKILYVAFAFLFIISLALCFIFIKQFPSAVFFLLPFRIFEFVVGGSVVFLSQHKNKHSVKDEILYIIGIFAILIAIVLYNKDTIFPGITALIPCLGTALMIYSCATKPVKSSFLLTSKPAVYIGKISYSLYLVHWPIIVYYAYRHLGEFTLWGIAWMVLLMAVAAVTSYHFVEQPFRKLRNGNPFSYLPAIAGTSFLLVFVGANIWGNNGWDNRINEEIKSVVASKEDIQKESWKYANILTQTKQKIFTDAKNAPKVLIIGDSLAKDLINSFAQTKYKDKINLSFNRTLAECRFEFIGVYLTKNKNTSQKCEKLKQEILSSDKYKDANIIIFSVLFLWKEFTPEETKAYISNLQLLSDNGKKKVIVFGYNMKYQKPALDILEEAGSFDKFSNLLNKYQIKGQYNYDDRLAKLTEDAGFNYIKRLDLICPDHKCYALTGQGDVINYDEHHYTLEGAKFFGWLLAKDGKFNEILNIE